MGVTCPLYPVLSAAAVCSSSQSGAAKGGEIVPFSHKLPLLPRPYGLACSTFVSVDKMSERRQVLPLELLRCDGLCTPQGADGADKYIYQYW